MNNPFSYFIVPQVWAPSVLQPGLPINTNLQAMGLEQQQQQQQQLMQSTLVSNSIYNCLSNDPTVTSSSGALKKAKTQHTIVGKPVMYGNKTEKKTDAPGSDAPQTESTSDYASDEHASDVNSENGTLVSSDSGRPDSTRNGASSLSPRTIESNIGKQNLKKTTSSPVQMSTVTVSSGKSDVTLSSNASRNSAKLIYHRKPDHLSVSNVSQTKHETKKTDEQRSPTGGSDKIECGSQKCKRRITDKESDKDINSDGSTAVKRAKVLGEKDNSPSTFSPAATNTTAVAAKDAIGDVSREATKMATTITTITTATTAVAETTSSSAITNSSSSTTTATSGSESTSDPRDDAVVTDGALLSTASLAHDDDMDLDDDTPAEETGPSASDVDLSATLMGSISEKSPTSLSATASLAVNPSAVSARSPNGSSRCGLTGTEAFENVATTWVSAPTVSTHSLAHYGQGLLMPTVSAVPSFAAQGLSASLYNPLAQALQAQANPYAAAQLTNPYHFSAAANHPLALINHAQPASSHIMLPGAVQTPSLLALRLQQYQQQAAASQTIQQQLQQAAATQTLQQLQQAAATQNLQHLQAAAAAQNYQSLQLPMGAAAAGQLLAQQPTAAASSQLFAPQAGTTSVFPQQHVLSITEELDPLRMILQKR